MSTIMDMIEAFEKRQNQPQKPRSGLGMLNRVEQVLNGTLVLNAQ